MAAEDHDALAAAVAAQASEAAITVASDPTLTSGQARMIWPGGGADLDAAALIARIAPLIAERLNDLKTRSER